MVECNGENEVDRDFIYEIEYFSQMNTTKIGGFHRNFFPFVNQDGYRSPLVFVHFKKIETNVLINVECRAYAQNIDHNSQTNWKYKTGLCWILSSDRTKKNCILTRKKSLIDTNV